MSETAAPTQEIISPAEASLENMRQQFSREIDWDALVEDAAEDMVDVRVDLLVDILSFPDASKGKPEAVGRNRALLDVYWDALIRYRLPKPEQPEPHESYASGDLATVIDDWNHYTRIAAAVFLSNARYNQLKEVVPGDSQRRLVRLARSAGLDGGSDSRTPAVIADAIERAAGRRMLAFERADFDILAQTRRERPNLTLMTGHQALTVSTGLDDPHKWIEDELDHWPDWARSGIGLMRIQHNILEETEGEQKDTMTQLGGWSQKQNRLRVSANTAGYFEDRAEDVERGMDNDESRALSQFLTRKRVRNTIGHEIMHNAHNNALPIRWLREWCEIVDADKTAVSRYVEITRAEDTESTAMREDLCESAAQYGNEPATLAWNSLPRFAKLHELFIGYKQDDVVELMSALSKLDPADPDMQDKLRGLDARYAPKFLAKFHSPVFSRP